MPSKRETISERSPIFNLIEKELDNESIFNNQFPSNVICVWILYSRSRSVDTSGSEGFFMGGRSLTALPIAGTIMTNPIHRANCWTKRSKLSCRMEVMAWEVTSYCNCRIGSHFYQNILNTVLIRFQISLKFVMIQLQNELFQSCLLLPMISFTSSSLFWVTSIQ